MIKVVLLVTFIVQGQAPYAFQINDMTKVHCDVAKEKLEKEYASKFPKLNGAYSIVCIERDIVNR